MAFLSQVPINDNLHKLFHKKKLNDGQMKMTTSSMITYKPLFAVALSEWDLGKGKLVGGGNNEG